MYLITFETSFFSFCYVSQNKTLSPLRKAWAKHTQQTQADPQHLEKNLDSVKILKVENQQVFRDFEPFL
jgi:hypothetical protein